MKKITDGSMNEYKAYLVNEEKSAATIEKYLRDLSAFKKWLCGGEFDKSTVIEYKSKLLEEYAPASVNSIISSLNSYFSYNEWFDCRVKTVKIQRQIFSSANKYLTKAEYERLLEAAERRGSKKMFYIMQTICSTGIRVSELKFITAEAIRKGEALISCKGKMRVVLLPRKLCCMLKQYMRACKIERGPVFVSSHGKCLDRSNIWKLMKNLCEAAGVARDKVFPHNLRHLFARTYYSLQKDVVRLADILGHSSINTTRIYTIETGDIHRRQIQSLGLLKIVRLTT